jgi:hypothetical protein
MRRAAHHISFMWRYGNLIAGLGRASHVPCLRMPLPSKTSRRRRLGPRRALLRILGPIHDDDESFPWRPIAVLLFGIVLIVATVITLSFLVAWLVTGQAY